MLSKHREGTGMKLAILNVGLSGEDGRGPVFPDSSFIFIPIRAKGWRCKALPRFQDLPIEDYTSSKYLARLGLKGKSMKDLVPHLARLKVHDDPSFVHFTYGHVKRGYGCEQILRSLQEDDILLFLATLDYMVVPQVVRDPRLNSTWGAYIVGAFLVEAVYDSNEFDEASKSEQRRFKDNPHYFCEVGADLWIAGKRGRLGLFPRAVPLSSPDDSHTCLDLLSSNFVTWRGRRAGSPGWFRHTLHCSKGAENVWQTILSLSGVEDSRIPS